MNLFLSVISPYLYPSSLKIFPPNDKSKLSDIYEFINNKYGLISRLYYIVHGCKIIDPISRTVDEFNKNLEDKRKISSDSNFRVTFRNI